MGEAGERTYQDVDGNQVSLDVLCMREPAWAANRIRVLTAERDAATAGLERLRETAQALVRLVVGESHSDGCPICDALTDADGNVVQHEDFCPFGDLDLALAETPSTLAEAQRRAWEAKALEEAADGFADLVWCVDCGLVRANDPEHDEDHVTRDADADDLAQHLRKLATERRGGT
jgi:hypothetical protein